MKYKGLGCRQSYEEAAALFKRGVELSSRGSMYMLGLCYRNGYGITLNTDSARYWLVKAAELGSPLAKEELQEAEPENAMALQHAKAPSAYVLNEKKAGQGFERVKHNVEKNKIAGVYTGYIIRYDWSGTYIIGRDKLTLKLLRQGNIITGEWTEGENLSAGVQASLSDSALVFQNTVYKRVDHYSAKKETGFEFRNAHLKLAASGDSVFLAGNIQLYSQRLREPEKPVYVSLVRTEQGEKKKKASFEKASEIQSQQMASNEVKIYPNPFSSSFQAGFTLTQPATVQLLLYAMNGQEVFRNTRQLPAGSHVLELKADVPAGTYIFKLVYGNTIKNSIIIKQ